MRPLYGDEITQEELDRRRTPVETLQWQVAARALELGIDVILDWGFWSRRERDDFRARAKQLGARCEVRYLDVPRNALAQRIETRNANLPPGTFHVTPEQLDLWTSWFEAPANDELQP